MTVDGLIRSMLSGQQFFYFGYDLFVRDDIAGTGFDESLFDHRRKLGIRFLREDEIDQGFANQSRFAYSARQGEACKGLVQACRDRPQCEYRQASLAPCRSLGLYSRCV